MRIWVPGCFVETPAGSAWCGGGNWLCQTAKKWFSSSGRYGFAVAAFVVSDGIDALPHAFWVGVIVLGVIALSIICSQMLYFIASNLLLEHLWKSHSSVAYSSLQFRQSVCERCGTVAWVQMCCHFQVVWFKLATTQSSLPVQLYTVTHTSLKWIIYVFTAFTFSTSSNRILKLSIKDGSVLYDFLKHVKTSCGNNYTDLFYFRNKQLFDIMLRETRIPIIKIRYISFLIMYVTVLISVCYWLNCVVQVKYCLSIHVFVLLSVYCLSVSLPTYLF